MKGVQPDLYDLVRKLASHLRQGLGKATEERLDYLVRNRRRLSA
jgi:hypothetical protein